jgi:MYXO-CTERM domain-containing protein
MMRSRIGSRTTTARRRRAHGVAWSSFAVALALPVAAGASNMTHVRTPVLWKDVPCVTLHDRSENPVMHLPYGITKRDTRVTPDEVWNSRRHQFFAFCRPAHPQNYLPNWIAQADVDDALEVGLVEKGLDLEGILESNTQWAGCWFRINEDAERRPITFVRANAGVDWDTSAVPAGVYTLYGYTYEPVFNVWWVRPGFVKVHDGDPFAVGPGAAIALASAEDATPYRDQEIHLPTCVHATEGATYTLYWAHTAAEPQWQVYEADVEVPATSFDIAFTPPEALRKESGLLRLDVTDGEGTYTAYVKEPIVTIDADDPDACTPGGSIIGNPCADSSGDDSADDDASVSSGEADSTDAGQATGATGPVQSGGDAAGGGEGCGCSTHDASPGAGVAWLVGIALRRRRSRRC